MTRVVVVVAVGAFLFLNPAVALAQVAPRSRSSGTSARPRPRAEARRNQNINKDESKRFDQFVQWARSLYSLPFKFSEVEKADLLRKYFYETDESPFFWTHLENTFREVKEERSGGDAPSPDEVVAADVVRGAYFRVMVEDWGALVLTSEPAGADVFLKISTSRTKEGKTRINRKYPEGVYTFIVELSGFKSKEVYVTIARDKPVEERVVLEKQ